jgi:hypothetical protein
MVVSFSLSGPPHIFMVHGCLGDLVGKTIIYVKIIHLSSINIFVHMYKYFRTYVLILWKKNQCWSFCAPPRHYGSDGVGTVRRLLGDLVGGHYLPKKSSLHRYKYFRT